MNSDLGYRRTSLCKCGEKAVFIKDYFVTETKNLKEGSDDLAVKRNVESACGILRRRFCGNCLSRVALKQKRVNTKLNTKIFFSVFIPLMLFAILSAVSYFVLKDDAAFITMVSFISFTVIASVLLLVVFIGTQSRRSKIAKGDYSNIKAIDSLIDSLNFGYDESKRIKELQSTDVLVDGDGRVNYNMERAGYNMRVLYNGKITLEPMRRRILYPFKDDAEYIRKSYTHAEFLGENIKVIDERELTEKDFDIKNGTLHRYSGLSVHVTVPDGVTKLGVQAFKKSKNCESITLPDTVCEIGKEAFAFCPASKITLPYGVKKISSFCFYSSAITTIELPDTVEEIEDNAFGECYHLESIVIPAGCKRIGEAAFKGCVSLTSVTLNSGLEALADYSFNGCRSLEVIEIPDGCYELGNFAFEGCESIKEVYLPETIQFVGGRVFEGAKSMTIVGKVGSYAESFANEHRLRFTAQVGPRYKKQHNARKL